MFILDNWDLVFKSINDWSTWWPIIIPFLALTVVFIVIAIIRKEKDKNDKNNDKEIKKK